MQEKTLAKIHRKELFEQWLGDIGKFRRGKIPLKCENTKLQDIWSKSVKKHK